jgi:predicted GNAT family N-acyltransferase
MIRFVSIDIREYQELLSVRNKVLRLPLGLDIKDDDLSAEAECQHLVYLDGFEKLVGGLQIKKINDRVYQVRQMAILPECQQRGIGSALLRAAEDFIRSQGGTEIMIEAREYAMPFYKKHGYEISGNIFIKISLPHYKMVKKV